MTKIQLNRIICATDFSDYANQTLFYGIALAKAYQAGLYVCHIVDLPLSCTIYGDIDLFSIEHQNLIVKHAHEEMKTLIDTQPFKCEPLITKGHTVDEITRLAEEKEAGLVIVASHGRSGFRRFILGSVTEGLMRTLTCPLLILRIPNKDFKISEIKKPPFKRILLGYDFSSDAKLALQYALGLARVFQGNLHIVHVITPSDYQSLQDKTPKQHKKQFDQELWDRHTKELTNLIPQEDLSWCRPKIKLLIGKPHEKLNDYAISNNIDLIVLGTRGLDLAKTFFIGSTTDRTIRQAPCPVLSVCHTHQDIQKK